MKAWTGVFPLALLEACRGTAVVIEGGSNCRLEGCTIRNVGHKAVSAGGGRPLRLEFKDPAAVSAIGFEPLLPLEKMGVYADPRRASWPVRHEVRPIQLP